MSGYIRKKYDQICIFCGNHFVGASEVSQVCNSEECQKKYRSIIDRQKHLRVKTGNPYIKICRHCGKEFVCEPKYFKNYRKVFCSDCKDFERDYYKRKRILRKNLAAGRNQSDLAIMARKAKDAGMSYGYYVAALKDGMIKDVTL